MNSYYNEYCKFITKPLQDSEINNLKCSMCFRVDKIEKPATHETFMTSGFLQTAHLCLDCINWTIDHHNLIKDDSPL